MNGIEAKTPDAIETSYSHDALGRVDNVTLSDEVETMTMDYTYDPIGRLHEVHYPSELAGQPFVVRYGYGNAGYLSTIEDVTGTNVTLWKATARDRHGRATNVTMRGGDIDLGFAYDAVYGKLTAVTAFESSSLVYKVSATIHDDGKLDTVTDGLHGYTDEHTYDELGRLENWTWTRNGTKRRRSFSYDATQRLQMVEDAEWDAGTQSWSVLEATGYSYEGARPHLLAEMGARALSWDDAGRLIERNNEGEVERIIDEYNTFDLPTRGVVELTEAAAFQLSYDAMGRRYKKTVGESETTYFDSAYERRVTSEGTTHVFKVYAESGLAAQLEVDAQGSSWKYIVPDLRSSPGAMLEQGEQPTYFYYEPNGKRVSEVGAGVSLEEVDGVHAGLTGHEHDLSLDLINMGGRVFDPTLRRFATPDPYSQGVTAGYLLDPYRHVFGDPINMTDPSGFWEEGDPHLETADDWDNGAVDDMDAANDYADEQAAQAEAADAWDAQADAAADLAAMDFADQSQDEDEWDQQKAKGSDDSGKPQQELTTTKSFTTHNQVDLVAPRTGWGQFAHGFREGAFFAGLDIGGVPADDYLSHWRAGGKVVGGLANMGFYAMAGPLGMVAWGVNAAQGVLAVEASVAAAGVAVAASGAVGAIVSGLSLSTNNGNSGGTKTSKKGGKATGKGKGKSSKPLSPNQMNQAIKRGQAPKGIKRVDTGKVPGEQTHVHFDDGAALNRDGTWKHGSTQLTSRQKAWLGSNGWSVPE